MKYTFAETIGQGGFGIVDRVVDNMGKSFARKTFHLNQRIAFSEELQENVKKRFIKEANIQQRLSHKNIVPVIYKDVNAVPPWFIMPLAISVLEDDIKNDKSLEGDFINVIMDIIAGLEELHQNHIYHRDLKPGNVLKFGGNAKLSERDYYSIGDFGLLSFNETKISTLTETGMTKGSDFYTAPEIVKSLRSASEQSDIYSLGCIIHDMVGEEDRVPLGEIKEDSEFGGILLNCTRQDVNRRFKSVADVRDALLKLKDVKLANTSSAKPIFDIFEKEDEEIDLKDWKQIISFIEDKYPSEDAQNILRKISRSHLLLLERVSLELFTRLANLYSDWIRERSFQFEECDGLASRLEIFIEKCKPSIQSECLMAMLYMGTNHNRYYVERKWARMANESMTDQLAKRLAFDMIADGEKAYNAIKHLEHSITHNLNYLHPHLYETFQEIENGL